MNCKLLGLLAAASLVAVACSSDNKPETTAAATAAATAAKRPDTLAAHEEARRTAAKVAADLHLTDSLLVIRLEKAYYTRGRNLDELQSHYTTDTTGRYQALRMANDQTDEEVRAALPNPAAYRTYATHRASYGPGPYSLTK